MDPQVDPNYFDKFIPATASLIITGLASVIIGIYFEKFRSKLTFLKYKIFTQPLATTSQNDHWGDIAVSHNKRIVKHISFVTVEIKNDSNHDLENINVDTWVNNQSQFLATKGNYNETGNSILLERGYFTHYNDVLERNTSETTNEQGDTISEPSSQLMKEIEYVMCNKKFH